MAMQLFLISTLVPMVAVLVLLRYAEPRNPRLAGAPVLPRHAEPPGLRRAASLVLLRKAGPRLQSGAHTAEFRAGELGAPAARIGRQAWLPSTNRRPARLCSS